MVAYRCAGTTIESRGRDSIVILFCPELQKGIKTVNRGGYSTLGASSRHIQLPFNYS
jgi:hypothetical protein